MKARIAQSKPTFAKPSQQRCGTANLLNSWMEQTPNFLIGSPDGSSYKSADFLKKVPAPTMFVHRPSCCAENAEQRHDSEDSISLAQVVATARI